MKKRLKIKKGKMASLFSCLFNILRKPSLYLMVYIFTLVLIYTLPEFSILTLPNMLSGLLFVLVYGDSKVDEFWNSRGWRIPRSRYDIVDLRDFIYVLSTIFLWMAAIFLPTLIIVFLTKN